MISLPNTKLCHLEFQDEWFTILLDNHKLNLNYKDKNLSINGEGQIQLNTDQIDRKSVV